MKVLLVEDEVSKCRKICEYLQETYPEFTISVTNSITSAIISLRHNNYDFLLLDMSLPLFDNTDLNYSDSNEFDTFGGMAVLEEIDRLQLSSKVILITAFDTLGEGSNLIKLPEINVSLKADYPNNYLGSVFYNVSSLAWKQKLRILLTKEGLNNEYSDS